AGHAAADRPGPRVAGTSAGSRTAAAPGRADELDLRAVGRRRLSRRPAGTPRRRARRDVSCGVQRVERGVRGRLPRRPDRVPRHRRHRRARRRRARRGRRPGPRRNSRRGRLGARARPGTGVGTGTSEVRGLRREGNRLMYLVGVLVIVLGVVVSIALHEVGHLVPAKIFGVKCNQYMIGFGPTLWSKRFGETEYGVKAIPLGGYVRMIGMFPPKADGSRRPDRLGRWATLAE